MSGLRQHIQRQLAREPSERGEAPITGVPEAEPVVAATEPESPATTMQLMEEVCERENLVRAWHAFETTRELRALMG
jgi:RNA-directed DNA polymerase